MGMFGEGGKLGDLSKSSVICRTIQISSYNNVLADLFIYLKLFIFIHPLSPNIIATILFYYTIQVDLYSRRLGPINYNN